MDIYDMMLEELEKGNALYVEVDDLECLGDHKLRIVTPNHCAWDLLEGSTGTFDTSCFIYGNKDLTPRTIIDRMKQFDRAANYVVSTFTVI